MALSKYKLGELIQLSEEVNEDNNFDISDVRGVSIKKEFIETKADMEGVSLRPYLIVKPGYFAYVTITSRNGDKISFAYNTSKDTYLVSSSYVVFYVMKRELLLPEYLNIFFNRPEFDRYSRFNSWGSAREAFSWEEMCDIDIELPPIEIQQKYVDIYQGMVNNQRAYERGLEDLKLVCDAMLDKLKKDNGAKKLGDILKCIDVRNKDLITATVVGININKELFPTVADLENTDLKKYKVLCNNQFAYSPMQTGRDESIRISLYTEDDPVLVSPAYFVLQLMDDEILPEYVMMWFLRAEFDRYGCFLSDGSVRASLDLNRFFEIEIPVPLSVVQKSIVDIFKVYNTRKRINEQLKVQIKDICPILIKGSIDEAVRLE